ncbi:hypothetical protein [Streptomyces sp. ISL-11]|uniref:hypothetical protein n=1 Tax=Streptomyces sp. ISL-11 TaxID=2819174 RepID=UPI001BED0731|nr:hypothetical protein [Streptomyces sp. ISL-11]MBT2384833.1 hypothetical protein [Streptomyces sp. ISL-11]
MADDHRYDRLEDWLDDDAAERLLSAPATESAPPEAERLMTALRSLAPRPATTDEPLPGEDAAVAAFLAMRDARAAGPAEAGAATTADFGRTVSEVYGPAGAQGSVGSAAAAREHLAAASESAAGHGPTGAAAGLRSDGASPAVERPAGPAAATNRHLGAVAAASTTAALQEPAAPVAAANGYASGAAAMSAGARGPAGAAAVPAHDLRNAVAAASGLADAQGPAVAVTREHLDGAAAPGALGAQETTGPAAATNAHLGAAASMAAAGPEAGASAVALDKNPAAATWAAPGDTAPRATRVDEASHPTVRATAAATRQGLLRRWRPVKAAIAMGIAGCALGGVAVAAGTGVLPAPFGSSGEPESAPSVSALETGGPGTAPATPGGPTPVPSRGKDGGPRESGRPTAPGSTAPGAGATGDRDRRDRPGDDTSARPDGRQDRDATKDPTDKDMDKDVGKATGTWAVRVCQDVLAAQQRRGKGADEDDMRLLERTAGIGADALGAYCEKLVKDADASTGGIRKPGGTTGGSDTRRRSLLAPPAASVPQTTPETPAVTFSATVAL